MMLLSGMTLLDFSTMGPGPRCTRLLADYGMRVVKVRPPEGETRVVDPPWHSYSANRGIPQVRVDLRTDSGREFVHRLLPQVDAMLESFRPGVAERLGLGYEQVAEANGSIVYCSISGYGQEGPYARWPAHDLNWLALGGFLGLGSPRADGGPSLPGAVVADAVGGFSAAVAVLAALLGARSTGEGSRLDVSVMDGVLRMMQYVLDSHLAGEEDGARRGGLLTGGAACYDVYRAGDGRWLAVGAIEPQFWAELCKGLGLEHRIPDQRDPHLQEALRGEFAAAFSTRHRDEWVAMLGPRACVSPVNTPAEVLEDPHLRGRSLTLDLEVGGQPVRQLAPRLPVPDPPDLATQPTGPTRPADADAVLRSLGIDDVTIATLRDQKVLA